MTECFKVTSGGVSAIYNPDEDTLFMEYINQDKEYLDDNLRYPKTFKQLTLCTTSFGDPIEARILGFKTDGWHFNRDLLAYVIVSHFDEKETVAQALVERLWSACKF